MTSGAKRSFQQPKDASGKTRRTLKFAEILAAATDVFGSREEAKRWLETPAIGLDQRRPIDLLATPEGVEIVEQYLGRIAHGVYT
jgi:putative toxin-antitoxin system antitoxin component (TIGR02293 family)